MPEIDTDRLELVRKNPSRDGEAYRGEIDGKDTLVKMVTDPVERDWLRHEVRILEQLEGSPHVPELYSYKEVDGKAYLAEQFVPGTSLNELLDLKDNDERGTPLVPHEACGVINRIGAAEQDLLQRGIMYRDLQGEHVIFANDDRRAVFVDLGLATNDVYTDDDGNYRWRQTDPNGTYKTMSPAELRGEDMSEADVVYRLAVLYHLAITGELPYEHPKRSEIESWANDPHFKLSPRLTDDGRELFENALLGDPDRQIKSIETFLIHMNRLKNQTVKPPLKGAAGLVTHVE